MTAIQTLTGPVEDTELGLTLSHEHLFLHSPGLQQQYPWLYDPEAAIAHVAAELNDAYAAGVRAMIDVTTPDLGRDIGMMVRAARRSSIHIVAATGIWGDIPHWFDKASIDEIADVFVREIEVGIAGSDVHAGVIKVASNDPPGVGELQEKALRGAARTAIRTSVPITTHTRPYDIGREQMRIFDDEGVPGHLVAIGHADTDDLDYLREVLAGGRYISVDHFQPARSEDDPAMSDAWREMQERQPRVIQAIVQLCEEGHADHIMLSHDHLPEGGWDWWPHGKHDSPSTWTYMLTHVRPALAELGVSEADLDTMLVTAPARYLAGERGE